MSEKENKGFLPLIIGSGISVITALLFILVFAGLIKGFNMGSGVIKPVNQFIKALAIFIGCFFCVKECKGLIKGAIIGVAFTIIIHLLFALVGSVTFFSLGLLLDIIFGLIIGAISGVISVNIRK